MSPSYALRAAAAVIAGASACVAVACRAPQPTSSVSESIGRTSAAVIAAPQGQDLQSVVLPDLATMEPSVRAQIDTRVASLNALMGNPASSRADLASAYGEVGTLFMAATFLDAAEVCLTNAQVLAPADPRWPYYLGHVFKAKGPVDKAIASFSRARELMPDDVPTMIWLGEVELGAGHADVADGVFSNALARQPGTAAAWFGAGRVALARRDYRRAVEQLTRALVLDPAATKAHYSLALAYRGLGDLTHAEAQMAQQGTVAPRPKDPLMQQVDGLLNSAEAFNVRGGAELAAQNWQAAADDFIKGLQLAPDDPSLRHRLGTALSQMGRYSEAIAQFELVLRTTPDYSASHYSLGVLLTNAGRYAEAIAHLKTAIRLQPDSAEARVQLAEALEKSGRREEALAQQTQALGSDPTNSDAALARALTLIRLHRFADAASRLAQEREKHPDQPMFTHALARLLAAAPDDRVRDGRRALTLVDQLMQGQQSIELAETTAMALAEVGRYGEAADVQRQALTAASASALPVVARHIADNLKRYERRQPCRTPFAEDELE